MAFHLYRDAALLWRWRLIASNGRIIADSAESYTTKANAIAGIGLVKQAYNAPVYEP